MIEAATDLPVSRPKCHRTAVQLTPVVANRLTSRDLPIEGLRGLAAAAVFFGHVQIFPLDPAWSPPRSLLWLETGQAAVLMFFILSGYVIGLTNAQPFSAARASGYLRRRGVRLIPINTLAVGLALLVGGWIGTRPVAGNLAFLQNNLGYFGLASPTLASNPNLWSLNYEVVCYLCFLAIWRWRPRLDHLLIVLTSVTLLMWWLPGAPRFLGAYAGGLVFWFAGLALAWLVPTARPNGEVPRGPWPSALLIALVTWKMACLGSVLDRLGLDTDRGNWINPDLLEFLPVSLWLVALAGGRENRITRLLPWLAVGWLSINFIWRIARGLLAVSPHDQFYLSLFLVGVALLAWRPSLAWLAAAAPFGGISFGFYAFAFPIQRFTAELLPAYSGHVFSYCVRLVFCTLTTCLLAWCAEHQLQPWIKQRLIFARTGAPVPD